MSAEQPGVWPLEHAEFEEWAASMHWQDAVTRPMNPHQYVLKRNTDSHLFELMVLHLREHGSQEWFGGAEYTYFEGASYKYWTMQNPLEWTIVVNRKQLPGETKQDEAEPKLEEDLPELYTSRYFAQNMLASGVVVPVRISMIPPSIVPLYYPVEHDVRALMPDRSMYGEWHKFSPEFWKKLDRTGPDRIGKELAAISEQHDGKALALLCWEDLQKGQRCHRVVVSAWWYEQTGWRLPELTDEGEILELHQLHRQVMPLRPR